jgi:hypothetical protein
MRVIPMKWVVEMQTVSFDDVLGNRHLLAFFRCLELIGLAKGQSDCDGWILRLAVEADDPQHAWSVAMRQAFAAARENDFSPWPIVAVCVIEEEFAAAKSR